MTHTTLITPDWPAPANIKTVISTRPGGHSTGAYASFNLAHHVDDDPQAVTDNRQVLQQLLGLTQAPYWLVQSHTNKVVLAGATNNHADASYTRAIGLACVVMTADCLPVLITNSQGSQVAAIHAGWRGLAAGIIEQSIKTFNQHDELLVYLGPAIGPSAFEVGEEVYQAFCAKNPLQQTAFKPASANKYYADLYSLATTILKQHDIDQIYGGEYCTYSQAGLFYSYRRDRGNTGRMASLIYRLS